MTIDPAKDGIDHINVYSRGRTALGRALSNFSPIGFELPGYGRFKSVEGFWYYIKTGMQHEELRLLYGLQAKQLGKSLEVKQLAPCVFEGLIARAIEAKIEQHPDLLTAVCENKLPYRHYYLMRGTVVLKPEHDWQLRVIENVAAKWNHPEL